MANEPKPIKRSRQLTPWSKDHHEGLLLVFKIRQGLKNGTARMLIADYVRWFWLHHLEEHFREEEELLAPYLQGSPMIERMFEEHVKIRELALDEGLDNAARLESFAQLLNDHIRFEERELFVYAEKTLPAETLDKIEAHIKQPPKPCPVWPHAFWIRK